MAVPSRVKGMKDLLPDYHNYFTFLKKIARHEFRKNGFRRIATPTLERSELFESALGRGSFMVERELYELEDNDGRTLALKPESTSGIMRAFIQSGMVEQPLPVYLYYIEPHFRQEKGGRGRYNEFWQIGGEIIGEEDPILDAQSILRGYNMLTQVGLTGEDFKVKINTVGNLKDREKYKQGLIDFYSNKEGILCEECRKNMKDNPMRLLSCKEEDCVILKEQAPQIDQFLKRDSKKHYKLVKEYLDIMGIEYEIDPLMVRNLDYYCHTVWEFVPTSDKRKASLGGGGRYDGLSSAIGHDDNIPAVGFAMGVERIIEHMYAKGIRLKNKDQVSLYFIQLGDEAKKVCIPLAMGARAKGINTTASLGTPSLSIQMKKATKIGAKFVVVIGLMEAKNGMCQVKDMEAGTQEEIKQEDLLEYIIGKIGEENLNFYSPSRDFIIK